MLYSTVGHRCIAPGFKPRPGCTRRVFHLSLRLITIEGRSCYLAYLVHKSGRKTATFTFSLNDLMSMIIQENQLLSGSEKLLPVFQRFGPMALLEGTH